MSGNLRRGYGIVSINVMRDPEIPGPAKALYAVLATYADHKGECYPSHETLARDLGAVEKSVRNWLQALVDAGVIERHRRHEEGREVTSLTVLLDLQAWHRSQPVSSSGGMEPSFPNSRNEGSIEQHQKNNTPPSEVDRGEPTADSSGSTSRRRRPSKPFPEEGLTPSDRNREYAEEHGLDLRSELERFQAHALANDRRQANWQQAFRQWLGNSVQFRAERGQRKNGQSRQRAERAPTRGDPWPDLSDEECIELRQWLWTHTVKMHDYDRFDDPEAYDRVHAERAAAIEAQGRRELGLQPDPNV